MSRLKSPRKRNTLKKSVYFDGVGLHSGKDSSVAVHPGKREGLFFLHDECYFPLEDARFRGDGRGTELAFSENFSVKTVEHLLSALAGLKIDDAVIEVSGEEIPAMDGCSLSFCQAFIDSGIISRDATVNPIEISDPLYIDDKKGERSIIALPYDGFRVSYLISYGDTAIGDQYTTFDIDSHSYIKEIAPCRTFALLSEVEMLRARGLAKGGSLENSLVVDGEKIMSCGDLRYGDEFVRHKVLDLIGDFSLLGRPLKAHVIALRAGHQMHQQMVKLIVENNQEVLKNDQNR